MANRKGSRAAVKTVANTMEQATMRSVIPALDPTPAEKQQYELATYRAARKHRGATRVKGQPAIGAGKGTGRTRAMNRAFKPKGN